MSLFSKLERMATMIECERCAGKGYLPTREWLKEQREKLGFSLRQTAVITGISASYLCLLENGKNPWTAALVARFDLLRTNKPPKRRTR